MFKSLRFAVASIYLWPTVGRSQGMPTCLIKDVRNRCINMFDSQKNGTGKNEALDPLVGFFLSRGSFKREWK
ncbi:hypothetical protein GCG54_00005714 [Colletotrichum gloeosporioides]|uniref:Secreted protein n=1 Tax=Colletotrichum gloeosporioides TaxID=474922 RepID=A0A8H4CJG6_COLGL|nr:uncharacterized protein GCG54_00005714 [Colletotrichum gloeosporioides]KAF3804969.1 hypothetical protein GCG54_00005714 [Colletotrichum gloeosporioides]